MTGPEQLGDGPVCKACRGWRSGRVQKLLGVSRIEGVGVVALQGLGCRDLVSEGI